MSPLLRGLIAVVVISLSLAAYGGWEHKENKNPYEDIDRSVVVASVDMYEGTDGLVVGVSCESDGLNVKLSHKYMSGDTDGAVRVQLRVDQDDAYGPKNWSLASNNRAAWMPMGDVPNLISQMRAGTKLVIRVVDPYDGGNLNQSVSLEGFTAALEKLSCYKA